MLDGFRRGRLRRTVTRTGSRKIVSASLRMSPGIVAEKKRDCRRGGSLSTNRRMS